MAVQLSLPAPTSADAKVSFLDLTPPPWAARGLAYALLTVFGLGALAAVIITLPEKVAAPFVLVPVRGADPVKATRSGVVTRLLVSEGQRVQQGEVLLTLRSEAAAVHTAEAQTIATQLAGAGASFLHAKAKLAATQAADEQDARKLQSRLAHLASLLVHKRQQLALVEAMKASYAQLHREGIASQAQLTAKQIEVSELASEVERLRAEQADAQSELDKLRITTNTRHLEFRAVEREFQATTRTREIQLTALQTALTNTDGNEVRLLAPCSGTILKLQVRDSGAVLAAGETLAELACGGAQLVAELTVPEAGIGKLQLEQGVKLKYDAFPYQRYGAKAGRLVWLSPAKAAGETTSFHARVALQEQEVLLNGQPRPFAAGMSGTAEIIVGKRTLLSYVFEPLRQLRENLR